VTDTNTVDTRYCSEKNSRVPCDKHFGLESCNTVKDYCEWHDKAHMCLDKGKPVPCFHYHSQATCEHSEDCMWEASAHTCKHKGAELHCNK
jgi:hypothetical protein